MPPEADHSVPKTGNATVAILLARGGAIARQSGKGGKAMLPIDGRPMAGYVLQALAESRVEKIFVVQDTETALEKAVSPTTKYIFLACGVNSGSLACSLYFAMEKLVDYYGPDELHRRRVMVVPCDIPLARGCHFDSLMRQSQAVDFDIAFTVITKKELEERYPRKHFHGVYLRDRQQDYGAQGIVFINGRILDARPPGEPGGMRLVVEGWDERMTRGMEETIDGIRQQRRRGYLWLPFVIEFLLKRLAYRGFWRTVLCLARDMTLRRLTLASIQKYLLNSFGMRVAFLESHEMELSGDIDGPKDLAAVLEGQLIPYPGAGGAKHDK